MSLIAPIEMNMSMSRTVLEAKWDNVFLDTVQKIALYTVVPFTVIAMFEAVVKNLIAINALNAAVVLINGSYDLYQKIVESL